MPKSIPSGKKTPSSGRNAIHLMKRMLGPLYNSDSENRQGLVVHSVNTAWTYSMGWTPRIAWNITDNIMHAFFLYFYEFSRFSLVSLYNLTYQKKKNPVKTKKHQPCNVPSCLYFWRYASKISAQKHLQKHLLTKTRSANSQNSPRHRNTSTSLKTPKCLFENTS